jgi:hypothetical protein
MKTSRVILHSLFITLLLCLPVCAQVQSKQPTRFSENGLVFDYPADMKLEDMSTDGGQQLVLVQGNGGAQIMIISRYDKISEGQLATARREVADAFATKMSDELKKLDPKLTSEPAQIAVGGGQATGVRLRAVLNNEPGRAEIYSLLLGKRLVLVTFIGSDKELATAADAWSIIRGTLKTDETAPVAPK